MYKIDKAFEFAYGHRVWSQTLDGNYAEDIKCSCRHLHGHEGRVQVYLESDKLTNSMVTDFKHLGWLKAWLNEHVDHKFIIDCNDPLYEKLVGGDMPVSTVTVTRTWPDAKLENRIAGVVPDVPQEYLPGFTIKQSGRTITEAEHEMLSGMLIVDFVPTSENLAKWLFDLVAFKMKPLGVVVSQVDWWETPKSRSSYTRG